MTSNKQARSRVPQMPAGKATKIIGNRLRNTYSSSQVVLCDGHRTSNQQSRIQHWKRNIWHCQTHHERPLLRHIFSTNSVLPHPQTRHRSHATTKEPLQLLKILHTTSVQNTLNYAIILSDTLPNAGKSQSITFPQLNNQRIYSRKHSNLRNIIKASHYSVCGL